MNGADILVAIAVLLSAANTIFIGALFMLRKGDLDDAILRQKTVNQRSNVLWDDLMERTKGKKFYHPDLMKPAGDNPDEILAESAPNEDDWSRMPDQVGTWGVKE